MFESRLATYCGNIVLAFVTLLTLIVLVYVYTEDDCLEAGLLLWILQLPTSLLIWTVFLPLRRSIDIP